MVTVQDLYRAMSTRSLIELQAAFQVDRASLGPIDRAFVDGRLALLARELQQRGPEPPPASCA